MTATANGHSARVRDAARTLSPGDAAAEAALVAVDLRRTLTDLRNDGELRGRLLSEVREQAAALQALCAYVAMFEVNP